MFLLNVMLCLRNDQAPGAHTKRARGGTPYICICSGTIDNNKEFYYSVGF